MCGIVGYTGGGQALPVLLDGLERLEYRGYDSAGVALAGAGRISVVKQRGRLAELRKKLEGAPVSGSTGIGHTRWATHGEPSDVNSHPHTNTRGTIAVVHNGIIENYMRIKAELAAQGYVFVTQTDTEVLAHLLDSLYRGDMLQAVRAMLGRIEGAYAIGVIDCDHPDTIIAVRKDNPLVIGLGDGENFIASDVPAILKRTRRVYFTDDLEIAVVRPDGVRVYAPDGSEVEKQAITIDWDADAAEKGGYAHFMLKEIHEEPSALANTLKPRLSEGEIVIDGVDTDAIAAATGRLYITACGTAYHAGLIAKYTWERMLGIPVDVELASEFRYRAPVISKGDLLIVISQSGETADTLAALRLGKARGASVLAITNVVGSTVSREADWVMYTWAGPEIAVASTKAYSTQVLCLALLMLKIGRLRGVISDADNARYIDELMRLPTMAAGMIDTEAEVAALAKLYSTRRDAYFIGRGIDYALALEASLKLKEISYVHSEAFAAGELKHGPIALIEPGTLLIAYATQPELYDKIRSNVVQTIARGACVLSIVSEGADEIRADSGHCIELPHISPWLSPILSVIPSQLFAYYCSLERGYDVDKPRNLAKSVTVE